MNQEENFKKIVTAVKDKACLKQSIYQNTVSAFQMLKDQCKSIVEELVVETREKIVNDVVINYSDKGSFEFQLKIGGDIILFQMHTNVFDFERTHSLHKTSYVKENSDRSFCGIINIYNFLADSFKYNRYEDSGYLIGRVFVNMDNHFFVEGRKQLNFLHNDFIKQTINEGVLRDIIQHSILYSMEFDLFTPPYRHVQEISVGQLIQEGSRVHIKTGKRVGYKFSFEEG